MQTGVRFFGWLKQITSCKVRVFFDRLSLFVSNFGSFDSGPFVARFFRMRGDVLLLHNLNNNYLSYNNKLRFETYS